MSHHIPAKPQHKFISLLILFLCILLLLLFLYAHVFLSQTNITQQTIQAAAVYGVRISTTSPILQGNITVTEKNKNQPIVIRKGSTLKVVLNSTYYIFNSLHTDVLQQISNPVYFDSGQPSYGAGSVTVSYKVVKSGIVFLSAGRTLCKLHCEDHAADFHEPVIVVN